MNTEELSASDSGRRFLKMTAPHGGRIREFAQHYGVINIVSVHRSDCPPNPTVIWDKVTNDVTTSIHGTDITANTFVVFKKTDIDAEITEGSTILLELESSDEDDKKRSGGSDKRRCRPFKDSNQPQNEGLVDPIKASSGEDDSKESSDEDDKKKKVPKQCETADVADIEQHMKVLQVSCDAKDGDRNRIGSGVFEAALPTAAASTCTTTPQNPPSGLKSASGIHPNIRSDSVRSNRNAEKIASLTKDFATELLDDNIVQVPIDKLETVEDYLKQFCLHEQNCEVYLSTPSREEAIFAYNWRKCELLKEEKLQSDSTQDKLTYFQKVTMTAAAGNEFILVVNQNQGPAEDKRAGCSTEVFDPNDLGDSFIKEVYSDDGNYTFTLVKAAKKTTVKHYLDSALIAATEGTQLFKSATLITDRCELSLNCATKKLTQFTKQTKEEEDFIHFTSAKLDDQIDGPSCVLVKFNSAKQVECRFKKFTKFLQSKVLPQDEVEIVPGIGTTFAKRLKDNEKISKAVQLLGKFKEFAWNAEQMFSFLKDITCKNDKKNWHWISLAVYALQKSQERHGYSGDDLKEIAS